MYSLSLFLDVIAIKFKCCDKYYPCYKCHDEHESHSIQRWTEKEFDKNYYVWCVQP